MEQLFRWLNNFSNSTPVAIGILLVLILGSIIFGKENWHVLLGAVLTPVVFFVIISIFYVSKNPIVWLLTRVILVVVDVSIVCSIVGLIRRRKH